LSLLEEEIFLGETLRSASIALQRLEELKRLNPRNVSEVKEVGVTFRRSSMSSAD